MGYTMDVIRRARFRLDQENTLLRSRYNARQEEAYAKLPRIREIDRQLRSTMIAAAQAVLSGQDAPVAMDAVRRENQALQAEREALAEKHFPKGYLDDPICKACEGTGYVGARMCQCLDKLCRQEQDKEAARLGEPYQRFDSFRLDVYSETPDTATHFVPRQMAQRALSICREYADDFRDDKGNLLLVGTTGLGKTFLAVSIGKTVVAQGKTVCYETAISLFEKLEKAKFNPTEESLRKAEELNNCDLLIVDDLGTEFTGQFVLAALYGLLNGRLLARKPMVFTTNMNWQDLEKRYTPQIASRLSGEFTQVWLVGDDIRKLRKQGN